MILNSIMGDGSDPALKEKGERILNNYKKQLAEKLAREAAENTNLFSGQGTSSRASRRSRLGNTMTSMKSSKSAKSHKLREREAEAQKLI